jgi:hypothetical protein
MSGTRIPSFVRYATFAALAGGIALLSAGPAEAAIEPTVLVKLTMVGCSGEGTVTFDPVSGASRDVKAANPVSWTAGQTIQLEDPVAEGAGPDRTIRLITGDGVVAFAGKPADAGGGFHLLTATLDCGVVPYRVVAIESGTVLSLPNSAAVASKAITPFQIAGLVLCIAAGVLAARQMSVLSGSARSHP